MPSGLVFEDFWARYPRKVGKQAARKAWERLDLGNGLLERIMQAVLDHRQSEAWTKDNGQFIPHPATWLNGKRWEDEPMGGRKVDVQKPRRQAQPTPEPQDLTPKARALIREVIESLPEMPTPEGKEPWG